MRAIINPACGESALSFARAICNAQSDLAAPRLWRACQDFF
jgi:hypothetical protein